MAKGFYRLHDTHADFACNGFSKEQRGLKEMARAQEVHFASMAVGALANQHQRGDIKHKGILS